MKQLSPIDSVFIYTESNRVPMHVSMLAFYDQSTAPGGLVRFKDILATFQERLPLAPILRRKLVRVPLDLDEPYWVEDPDFDIEYHVRHIALPKPGDRRQLNILVSRLHGHPMRLSRPLWDVYVIEGLDNVDGLPEGSFAVLVRVHHAAIDGDTGHQLIWSIHDSLNGQKPKIPRDEWQGEDSPSVAEMVGKGYVKLLKRPWEIAKVAKKTLPALQRGRDFKHNFPEHADHEFVETRFNAKVSPHRVLITKVFDLNMIRKMKSAVEGATVNDVIVTLTAGAMRRYLLAKGDLPEEDLVTMMPINIRDNSEKHVEGNLVSITSLIMHTSIENPVERLDAVHESAIYTKAYQKAIGAKTMTDAAQAMPAALMSLGARVATGIGLGAKIPVNTLVTNVPGSREPLYLNGAKMMEFYGIAPNLDGLGLCHAVNSYCDTISFGISADRMMLPDPEFYEQCLVESYGEMVQLCVPRSPARKKRKSA